MGLKCSVIGHKYGSASVEREREEQGSEVVITIQETETCERCGKTRVVSENKEVTAIETPSDIAGEMVDDEPASEGAEPAPETDVADTDAGAGTERAVEHGDAESDDAEILDTESPATGDSEPEDPSTATGSDEVPEAEPAVDPDERAAADPETDDGVIIDGDAEEAPAGERDPGQWPEEPNDDEDDWAPETVMDDEEAEESPDVDPLGGSAVTVPNGEFRCPECEFTTDVESSSLRAGDFCPECHKGALVHTGE